MVSSQISSTSVAFDYSEDLLDVVKKHGYATGLIGKNHPHRKQERFDYNHRQGTHRDAYRQQDGVFDRFLDYLNNHYVTEPTPSDLHFQFPARIVQDMLAYFRDTLNPSLPGSLSLSLIALIRYQSLI